METVKIRMQKVENPDPAIIYAPTETPAASGLGDSDYSCAGCDAIMLQRVIQRVISTHVVFKCPHCGTHNAIAEVAVEPATNIDFFHGAHSHGPFTSGLITRRTK